MSKELATKEDQGMTASTVKGFMALPSTQKRVNDLLGDRASQFMTSVSSMIGADDNLAACEPVSLFMACLTAAALDLPINKNLGFAHIIPYKNNRAGVTEAQFQLGWKGTVQLAQRSGQYKSIAVTEVRDGQLIKEDPLRGNEYDWTIEGGDVIGYVAMFTLVSGFEKELYMSLEQIKKHAQKYSQAYKSGYGPWKDNFDAMALKTVVKLLISKWGPQSIEMQKAIQFDQGVIHEDETVSYLDGELADVNATDDKKAAIVAANKAAPEAETIEPAASGDVASEPPAAPKKKTVKEQVEERGWTKNKSKASKDVDNIKQAGLLDDSQS